MSEHPTENGKHKSNEKANRRSAGSEGDINNGKTDEKRSQPENGNEEPLPPEVRQFVGDMREFFREIKKFVIFIRNSKNANAALVVLTLVLAIATLTQAIVSWLQLAPLKENTETANRQLELASRPWIKIANPRITAPLIMDSKGNTSTTLEFETKNVGHTPALQVSPMQAPLAITFVPIEQELLKKSCSIDIHPEIGFGRVVFPDGDFVLESNVASGRGFRSANEDRILYQLDPSIVGCVRYRSSFSDKVYSTGFVYRLEIWRGISMMDAQFGGDAPLNARTILVPKDGKLVVQPSDIRLTPYLFTPPIE